MDHNSTLYQILGVRKSASSSRIRAAYRSKAKTGSPRRRRRQCGTLGSSNGKMTAQHETAGWCLTCTCENNAPVPATVLDPFFGTGTTGLVADRLHRHAIGIELNPDFAEMARQRITGDAPLFTKAEVA